MLFAGENRDALRKRYVEAWRRRREGLPLEPLDAAIADVVELHPEYQSVLADEAAILQAFSVDEGRTNPFLHMGLHLALREQLTTRRPAGIEQVFAALARRLGSAHDAEHRMIDALAQTLWEAQRRGVPPDEAAYLERLRRL